MRIGELGRRAGVSERALRYYEEQGMLRPIRQPNGYREYHESAVATVARIRSLLAAGVPTAVIARVLPCVGGTDRLVPTCPDMVRDLLRERARISSAISQMLHSRDLLDAVLAAAPPAVVASVSPEASPVG